MLSPGDRSELKLFGIIAVNVLRNIDREEELDVSFGIDYTLRNIRSGAESQKYYWSRGAQLWYPRIILRSVVTEQRETLYENF